MNTKKSAVDLTDLAFGILILGISVTIGANVIINLRTNQQSQLDTTQIANETVAVTDQGVSLGTNGATTFGAVTNTTGGEVIPATNYTTTAAGNPNSAGSILIDTTSAYNNSNINVTYTVQNAADPRWSVPNDTLIGLSEYGNWFDIIVIVGIAGLILALIYMAFGNRSGNEGVNY